MCFIVVCLEVWVIGHKILFAAVKFIIRKTLNRGARLSNVWYFELFFLRRVEFAQTNIIATGLLDVAVAANYSGTVWNGFNNYRGEPGDMKDAHVKVSRSRWGTYKTAGQEKCHARVRDVTRIRTRPPVPPHNTQTWAMVRCHEISLYVNERAMTIRTQQRSKQLLQEFLYFKMWLK